MNRLYYGDNLDVLREHIADASVDLVYLDPPFNSDAGYNVLFKSASGAGADASIEAFDDTWTWGEASKSALMDIDGGTNRPLQVMMRAMHDALGDSPLMAYLAMMAVRLVELHRALRETGSLYLHCDPTASHYLKLVLDAVFGAESFRNHICWKRSAAHGDAKRKFGSVTDHILFYARSPSVRINKLYTPHSAEYLSAEWKRLPDGRLYKTENMLDPSKKMAIYEFQGTSARWRYNEEGMWKLWNANQTNVPNRHGRIKLGLDGRPTKRCRIVFNDELPGTAIQDNWTDISYIAGGSGQSLGYPTQKPRALLERIIAASSNPGDVVLDPFCGCGTAVDAAQKLGRRWIGIDITHIAIGMIENRMREGYPGIAFDTIGVPRDLASAERLAADDPHQFQQWVCWQVGGYPRDKKGGDKGIDGWFNYEWADPDRDNARSIQTGVISVKAGDIVNPTMVRDLGRVMERDKFRFGLFIMKSMPTKGMREEAASHPTIDTQWGRFPALQIITLAELMLGQRPKLPPLISPGKKAARVETRTSHQTGAQGNLI